MQLSRPDDPRPRRRQLLNAALRSEDGHYIGYRRGRRLYHFDGEFWFELGPKDPDSHCRPLIDATGRTTFTLMPSGEICGPDGELMATLRSTRALVFIVAAILAVGAMAAAMWALSGGGL